MCAYVGANSGSDNGYRSPLPDSHREANAKTRGIQATYQATNASTVLYKEVLYYPDHLLHCEWPTPASLHRANLQPLATVLIYCTVPVPIQWVQYHVSRKMNRRLT